MKMKSKTASGSDRLPAPRRCGRSVPNGPPAGRRGDMRQAVLTLVLALVPGATQAQDLERWTIDDVPSFSVGIRDGSDPEMFVRVKEATILDTDVVAILDYGAWEIRTFDLSGTHIASFGREGDGPGEFRGPFGVSNPGGDTIVVWDYARAANLRFLATGEFVDQVPISHPRTNHEGELLSDGSVAVPVYEVFRTPDQGRYRPPANLIRYGDGAEQDLGPFPYDEMIAGHRSGAPMPFASRSVVHAGGDPLRIAIADNTNELTLRLFDADGQLLRSFEVFDARRPVTNEIWAAQLSDVRRQYGRNNAALERKIEEWGRPELTPAMTDLVVDDQGRVWVLIEGPEGLEAYVHDRGAPIARLPLPDIDRVFEVVGGRILGLRRGPFDVESVVIYRFSER